MFVGLLPLGLFLYRNYFDLDIYSYIYSSTAAQVTMKMNNSSILYFQPPIGSL